MMSECQQEFLPARDWLSQRKPYILGVIPARWESSRFPGKPLADIHGSPMIWHVYQRCVEAACLYQILVATDDDRIARACMERGMPWMMTRSDHQDCLDRVAEVAESVRADRYICVQGDEPLISPEAIRRMATTPRLPACGYANSQDGLDAADATVPKVVVGESGEAVYLSRAPVPYPQRRVMPVRFQVCVYALDAEALQAFRTFPPGPIERQEGIGLLRFIEHRYPVWMVEVPPSPVAVDTPADLERAKAIIAGQDAQPAGGTP